MFIKYELRIDAGGGVSTPLPEWGGLKDLYAGI